MICLRLSHYREIEVLRTKAELANERLAFANERISQLEHQRDALARENNALIDKLQEADEVVQMLQRQVGVGGSGLPAGAKMPVQARDWRHVAESLEARAELESYTRGR